jgi:hypothetical protein
VNTNQNAPGRVKRYWRIVRIIGVSYTIFIVLFTAAVLYFTSYFERGFGERLVISVMIAVVANLIVFPLWYLSKKMGVTMTVPELGITEIVNSGSIVESITTAGYLGHIYFTRLTLDVYPAGFIVYGDGVPKLTKTAVHAEEITGISYEENGNASGLEIKYKAPAVVGPILLRGVTLDSRFASALVNIAGPSKVQWTRPI